MQAVMNKEFRCKFEEMVTLEELKRAGAEGGLLKDMQLLKSSRLSVSKVSREEWRYIMEEMVTKRGEELEAGG